MFLLFFSFIIKIFNLSQLSRFMIIFLHFKIIFCFTWIFAHIFNIFILCFSYSFLIFFYFPTNFLNPLTHWVILILIKLTFLLFPFALLLLCFQISKEYGFGIALNISEINLFFLLSFNMISPFPFKINYFFTLIFFFFIITLHLFFLATHRYTFDQPTNFSIDLIDIGQLNRIGLLLRFAITPFFTIILIFSFPLSDCFMINVLVLISLVIGWTLRETSLLVMRHWTSTEGFNENVFLILRYTALVCLHLTMW